MQENERMLGGEKSIYDVQLYTICVVFEKQTSTLMNEWIDKGHPRKLTWLYTRSTKELTDKNKRTVMGLNTSGVKIPVSKTHAITNLLVWIPCYCKIAIKKLQKYYRIIIWVAFL